MPHKCVTCNNLYADDASEVMDGCACGSKVFLFVRKGQEKTAVSVTTEGEGKYEIDLNKLFSVEH